jgi:hypothetical protein
MNPLAAQAYAPVAWTLAQIIPEQLTQVGQDLRLAGRVEPVTAVINRQSTKIETAGVPADIVALLDDDGLGLIALCELPRCANTGRTSAEDCHSRSRATPHGAPLGGRDRDNLISLETHRASSSLR